MKVLPRPLRPILHTTFSEALWSSSVASIGPGIVWDPASGWPWAAAMSTNRADGYRFWITWWKSATPFGVRVHDSFQMCPGRCQRLRDEHQGSLRRFVNIQQMRIRDLRRDDCREPEENFVTFVSVQDCR